MGIVLKKYGLKLAFPYLLFTVYCADCFFGQ